MIIKLGKKAIKEQGLLVGSQNEVIMKKINKLEGSTSNLSQRRNEQIKEGENKIT
jgi:hypothetical protein